MAVHLEPNAAEAARSACDRFLDSLRSSDLTSLHGNLSGAVESFDTARQIGTVYSLFAGEDLRTLLNGFVTQVEAMSMLFATAGGLIEAQDEAVAAALGKAAAEPAGLQSAGLMAALALNGPSGPAVAMALANGGAPVSPEVGGYDRVGPEDVSTTPLERIVTAAESLDPVQFSEVQQQVSEAASTLESAATTLRSELDGILNGPWQGEFAQQGAEMANKLTGSALDLVSSLEEVATRADGAQAGFSTTRSRIATEALKITLDQARIPGTGSGPGAALGPADPMAAEAAAAARLAAEEQARAVVNTEYSPAVMKANLDDLLFPTAFRVVSGTALGGPNGVDPVTAWNIGGVPQTAGAAAPGPAALAAASGGGAGNSGVGGFGAGPATVSSQTTGTDATTEQALLASRTGAGEATGLSAASGPTAAGGTPSGATGAPVNAATTAAGAPMAPVHGAAGQLAGGAGASGIRGLRGAGGRGRDRGFGSAAGLAGGGGAAAAGAGASRMGGAGTLAGMGSAAGPGGGVPAPGGPGAGAGTASGAAAGAGGMGPASSSSGSTTAGRPGTMPMGMMGGAAGQGSDRRGHTPAGYLTNATNTTDIIGDPVKVAPAVLGRKPVTMSASESQLPELEVAGAAEDAGPRTAGRGIPGLRAIPLHRRPANPTNE